MLQQIIQSITRAIIGRVAEAHGKLRNTIDANAATVDNLIQQQQQTNAQLWADVQDKERRIVENRLDTNKLQDQAISFEKNTENLVRDLESHKTQIWADVLDKERRIVDNTLGVQSLQQSVQDIWANVVDKDRRIGDNSLRIDDLGRESEQLRSDLYETGERVSDLSGNFKQMFGELSNAHYKLENETKSHYDALTGLIDDTNLDSIREIADRIKAEAKETQTIRQEMQNADVSLNRKIEALLPAELQNKTAAEWEQFIEDIVAQELAAQEAAATR